MDKTRLVTLMESFAVTEGPAEINNFMKCMEAKTSIKDNVIEGVHILGFKSANGYEYTQKAVNNAVALYEGVDIYIDHTDKKGARSVAEKFGFVRNVSFDESTGLWGDLVANEKHNLYEQVMWWAENHPSKIGLSHHAGGVMNKDKGLVEEIKVVKSVDIVTEPATVGGLFESLREGVIADRMDKEKVMERWHRILATATDLIFAQQNDFNSDLAARAVEVRRIADDLSSIMQDFMTANPQLDPANTSESITTPSEDEEMEYKDVTLEGLVENRPELVESIRSDERIRYEAFQNKVQESVKEVPESLRTDFFMEMVRTTVEKGDEDKLKKVIENQKGLAPKKPISEGPVVPNVEEQQDAKKDDLVGTWADLK